MSIFKFPSSTIHPSKVYPGLFVKVICTSWPSLIVLIIVPSDKKADILKVLYEEVGMSQEAQGIAISIPVDDMTENLRKQLFASVKKK